MASKNSRKKTSVDIKPETWTAIQSLKKSYKFRSSGEVIDMAVEVFHKAYLEKITKLQ